jgi:signal transduction histidine kinase
VKICGVFSRNRSIIAIILLIGFGFAIGWVVLLFKNDRQKRKYNEQLTIKNQELERIDEAKTRFFSNIAHELKTPLTMIREDH